MTTTPTLTTVENLLSEFGAFLNAVIAPVGAAIAGGGTNIALDLAAAEAVIAAAANSFLSGHSTTAAASHVASAAANPDSAPTLNA